MKHAHPQPAKPDGGDFLVTADAGKVSPAEFFRTVFPGPTRAEHYAALLESCIAAIKRGDTFGWPPAMVEDAAKLMSEREGMTVCVGDPLLAETASDWLLKAGPLAADLNRQSQFDNPREPEDEPNKRSGRNS